VLALLFSISAHLILVLGLNSRTEPLREAPAPLALDEGTLAALFVQPDDPPPPADPLSSDVQPADPQDAASAASLPEPISTAVVADITTVIAPSMPVLPHASSARWTVPESALRAVPAAISAGQVFKLGELDRKPVLLARVDPVYPPELTTASLEGVVVVHFIVNSRGAIEHAEVVSAPHPLLGAAVTRALNRWQFRAGSKNGRAVNTEMELPVRFNLSGT